MKFWMVGLRCTNHDLKIGLVVTTPHASWAVAYDRLYENSFGSFYERLTELTLAHIQEVIQSNSKIIDFGAGTGRLAIPLAKMGHSVTAVEPCTEMLDVLRTKVGSEKSNVFV